jgi:hypothetical protein
MTSQEEVTRLARQHAGEALRRLAETAGGSGNPDLKRDARKSLEAIIQQLLPGMLEAMGNDPRVEPKLRQAALELAGTWVSHPIPHPCAAGAWAVPIGNLIRAGSCGRVR